MEGVKRTLIFIIVLFMFISSVSAMRGTPAIVTITYDPAVGLSNDFQLNFVSTENPPGIADVSTMGKGIYEQFAPLVDGTTIFNTSQLDTYIKLDKPILDLSKEHIVNVHIEIPPNEPLAGPYEFGIIGSERPSNPNQMLVITTSVIIRVKVDVPYPGKYADISVFGIRSVNQGQDAKFNWQVKGRGSELTACSANLEIFSKDNTRVYERELGNFVVAPTGVYPPAGTPDTTLPTSTMTPGTYTGVLTVKFDDKVKTSTLTFNVGEEAVALDNYTPSTLVFGEINQVHLFVRNLWNGRFDNVHADINLNGTITTTPSGAMDPFGSLDLVQFMDSRNIPVGNYTGTVTVYFGTKSNTFPVKFEVAKKVVPPSSKPVQKTPTYLFYLISGVILLLVILVLILIQLKRSKKPLAKSQDTELKSSVVSVPGAPNISSPAKSEIVSEPAYNSSPNRLPASKQESKESKSKSKKKQSKQSKKAK